MNKKDKIDFEKFNSLDEFRKLKLIDDIKNYLIFKAILEDRIEQEYNIQIGNFVGVVC